jgi:hypothetical protein
MGVGKSTLQDKDRQKLDSIVQEMIDNNEPEDNIRFVVDDFKSKYSKKKDDSGISASASAMAGSLGLTPLSVSKEQGEQAIATQRKFEQQPEFNADDPVGSVKTILYGDKLKRSGVSQKPVSSSTTIKKPLEAQKVEVEIEDAKRKDVATVQNIFKNDTNVSLEWLSKKTGLPAADLYKDENTEVVKGAIRNETDLLAYERLSEAKNAVKAIQMGGEFEDIAANFGALQDPKFAEQLQKLQGSPVQQQQSIGEIIEGVPGQPVKRPARLVLGEATMGRKLFDFMSNSAVQQEILRDPELMQQFKQKAAGLINQYPEFGKMYIGNIISQKMEEMKIGNGIMNVVTKAEADKVVEQAMKDGQLSLTEAEFYKKNIRPRLGFENLGRAIVGKPAIQTSGLLENALQGGIQSLRSLGQTVAELPLTPQGESLRTSLQGDEAALSGDIERTERQVSVKPIGVWHEITQYGGQFGGQALATGGIAKGLQAANIIKSPAAALALSGGMQAYGNYMPIARQMFPDSRLKQQGFATIMAAIEAGTENIFKDDKVVRGLMGEMKPFVRNTIEEFTEKGINAAAAKRAIRKGLLTSLEKVPKAAGLFAKSVGENTLEEVVAELGNQVTSGVFEGKPISEWVDAEELANTARQAFFGSVFIAGLSTRADMNKNRGIAAKQIYLMAREPEFWADQIRQSESKLSPEDANDIPDKLKNLEDAAQILQELDKNTDLSEQQKAKYLVTALDSRVKERQQPTATDPVLANFQKKPTDEAIQQNQKIQEDILTGKDDGIFEGDESDKVNPEEAKLFEQIEKVAPEGYKDTLAAARKENNVLGGLEYMQDKVSENPIKFREDFGDDLTDQMIKNTPTEKFQAAHDFLIENNTDDPALPVIDKIIEERSKPRIRVTAEQMEAAQPQENEKNVTEGVERDTEVNEPSQAGETTEPVAGIGEESQPATEPITVPEEGDMTGITHAQMNKISQEFGLSEYQEDPETVEEWDQAAAEQIQKDPNAIGKVINKMRKGTMPSAVEQRILIKYVASLQARLRKNPTNELLDELKRVKDLSNIVGGRLVGKSLRARQAQVPVIEELGSAMIAKMESLGVEELTEEQKSEVTKQVDEYEKKAKEAETKLASLQAEYDALLAEKAVKKISKTVPKSKKTKDEYREERKNYLDELKAAKEEHEKWLKDQGIHKSGIGITLTPKMIKAIGKIAKSHIQEIGDNVSEVAKRVYDDIKELFDGITLDDVNSILTDVESEAEITKIEAGIKRTKAQTEDIKRRIFERDFEPRKKVPIFENAELKKKHPKLFNEALDALNERDELKRQFDIELLKDEMAKRSNGKKIYDMGGAIIATMKAITAGIDFSATFIQNNIAAIANPRAGGRAFIDSFTKGMFSEKKFRRELQKLHQNKDLWDLIEKSELDITDPNALAENNKEESFDNNLLNKDIVIKGKRYNIGKYTTKPFERAFTSMGNSLRTKIFLDIANQLMESGKTFDSHPDLFKDAATLANTLTGRGKLPQHFARGNKFWSSIIWSPKLMAARLNILGFGDVGAALRGERGFYRKMSPEMRMEAARHVSRWFLTQATILAAAALAGYDVDDEPTSPTFGDIKLGENKSYNFSGQHSPYLGLFARLAFKERTNKDGSVQEIDKEYGGRTTTGELVRFLRGRTTPFFSTAWDVIERKDYMGKPTTVSGVALRQLPLSTKSIVDDIKRDGPKSLFTAFGPGILGIKVSDKRDFPEKEKKTFTIYNRNNTTREATKEEYGQYLLLKEEKVSEKLNQIKSKGVGLNKYGELTLDKDEIKKRKPYEDLTEEESKELDKRIAAQAASEAKQTFQPKKRKI